MIREALALAIFMAGIWGMVVLGYAVFVVP